MYYLDLMFSLIVLTSLAYISHLLITLLNYHCSLNDCMTVMTLTAVQNFLRLPAFLTSYYYTLTTKRRAKGKFHYPTAGLFSASLKMKIKIFFLLKIVKNDVKKHEMQLFPFRFHPT